MSCVALCSPVVLQSLAPSDGPALVFTPSLALPLLVLAGADLTPLVSLRPSASFFTGLCDS